MLKLLILRQLSTYNFATVPLTLARFVFAIIHLGMSIEETLYRFRNEQKAKLRRKGPKLH